MNDKIKFLIKVIIRITIGNFLCLFFKRNPKRCVFALKLNQTKSDAFLHNTKYLFLYLSNTKRLDCAWLCDDKKQREILNNAGYENVYTRNSLKGFYYTITSKYFFYDIHQHSITYYFLKNAVLINLWHGIPLKKVGKDAIEKKNIAGKIQRIISLPSDYFILNNDNYEKEKFISAFESKENQLIYLGSPRLDILYKDIKNSELFMKQDYKNIKNYKVQEKKIFVYMPTFRDTGKDISRWLKSEKLQQILKNNNAILICKLHSLDKNSLDFDLSEEFYKMDSDSDVYPILKYTDALITDYSSVYFDYLLLDKPILYYSPDLKEYQEKCRGFYEPYEKLTAGAITQTEEELFSAMQNVIDGVDNYTEQRKALRDRMFKYQDGRNCERIVEWVKSLDK